MKTPSQLRQEVKMLRKENTNLRAQLDSIAEIVGPEDDEEEEDDEE